MNPYLELIVTGLRAYRILEISQVLSQAAVIQGLDVKTAEFTNEPLTTIEIVHIRIGKEIYSPLALENKVDILVCFEPIIAIKSVLKYLSSEITIIMNTHSILPYIDISEQVISLFGQLTEKIIKLDVIQIAKEAGDVTRSNFVMLGALDGLNVIPIDSGNIIKAAEEIVGPYDIKICIKAMEMGSQAVSAFKR